jgi:hypothetical protein
MPDILCYMKLNNMNSIQFLLLLNVVAMDAPPLPDIAPRTTQCKSRITL